MKSFKRHFHMTFLLILLTGVTGLGQSGSSANSTLPPNLRHLTPYLGTNPQPMTRGGEAPNCWNWALYISGGLTSLHFTDAPMFDNFLNSSFCRPVTERTARAGLIGVIKTLDSDSHLHAFYTLEENRVLTRTLSFNPNQGAYEIDSLTNVKADFHRPLSDPQCQGAAQEQSICGSTLSYYSCQFPQESLLSDEYLQLVREMKQFETSAQEYFLNRSRQTAEVTRNQENALKQKLSGVITGLATAFTAAEAPKITLKEKELLKLRLQSLLSSLIHLSMPQEYYVKRQQLLDALNRTP